MRIRTRVVALAATLALALFGASAATAITNGVPDGANHPYVGLMVAQDEDGVPLWRCSGSLLSPTLYLTAGHCVEAPAAHVEIWFSAGTDRQRPRLPGCGRRRPRRRRVVQRLAVVRRLSVPGDTGGTPRPYPEFCTGCGNGLPNFAYRDVGVVFGLDPAVPTALVGEYAELPEAGLVDTLANKTPADFVGYGVQFQANIPGSLLPQPPPFYRWTGPRQRMFAPGEIVSGNFKHSAEFIRFSLNPGGGSGGTCFGDSGGPDLLGGTDTVLAVNSYVTNYNCSGVGYSQRIDIPEVLAWIGSFL